MEKRLVQDDLINSGRYYEQENKEFKQVSAHEVEKISIKSPERRMN